MKPEFNLKLIEGIKRYYPLTFRTITSFESWRDIFMSRKRTLSLISFIETINSGLWTFLPFIFIWAFDQTSTAFYIIFIVLLLLWMLSLYIKDMIIGRIELEEVFSVHAAATESLIQTDPIHHTTKESGYIISKVDNGTNAIEIMYDEIIYTFVPTCASLIVVLTVLAFTNIALALSLALILVCCGAITYVAHKKRVQLIRQSAELHDKVEDIILTAISQAHFIRSLFQTKKFADDIQSTSKQQDIPASKLWMSFDVEFLSFETFFQFCMIASVLSFIRGQFSGMNQTVFIGLLGLLAVLFNDMLKIGRGVKNFMTNRDRIKNLFEFIHSFKKISFPSHK